MLLDLVREADIFLINFLPDARRRLKLELDDIRKANPNIIYVRGSGHGQRGPDAEKGGYDGSTFWCRSGTRVVGDAVRQPPRHRPAGRGLRRLDRRHDDRGWNRRCAVRSGAHRGAVGGRRLADERGRLDDGAQPQQRHPLR